ncbi:E3 SUMO-protein ligase ZBED1 [Labeo rohita]|uniref:E3 SUMO-protein ligase ZBED1 n=1 Tax=Labeo rohita TaxID=84645 RepID=A0ABQ8L4J3_LABRO|nr:E3 SUMO-protein ligase ZBED1 [Labeo rohita]
MTAAKNVCLKRTVRLNMAIFWLQDRRCVTNTGDEKLWSRREEIQLISTVIWHTTTGSYMKTSESVRPNLPKLLTKSQVTIKESYRQLSIKVLQMQRLTEKTSKCHKELIDAITHFLAKDMMPVNTANKEGFVGLINKLDRRYQLPSINYFSHVAIPQMYGTCVKTVSSELSQVDLYASTTDLWSSRTTEPYMSYTVHFLTQDFELKARCLGVVENIAHGLRDVLASWNLKEENQVSITTDNGTNVVKATELNNSVRLQCFGHHLYLAIVGHFPHTWKGKMALKKAQKEHNLPEHSLITECPTRWGSRQRMIHRVLEQQWAISDVLSADRNSRHLVPSWQDPDVLESINQLRVSYVKPVLHLMNTSILAANEEDSDLTKSIKMKILEYINTKYDNPATQELLDMTSFMDPRFKANYISSDKVSDIRTKVMSEIEATVLKEQSLSNQDHQGMGPTDVTLKKAKKSLGSFFKTSPAPSSMEPSHTVEVEQLNYVSHHRR